MLVIIFYILGGAILVYAGIYFNKLENSLKTYKQIIDEVFSKDSKEEEVQKHMEEAVKGILDFMYPEEAEKED